MHQNQVNALGQLRLRTPRPTIAAPCQICGRRMLTDNPAGAYHTECLAKPKPCECGQPSMPWPACTHCRGSGRLTDHQVCPYCPAGPCVACVTTTLLDRIRETR